MVEAVRGEGSVEDRTKGLKVWAKRIGGGHGDKGRARAPFGAKGVSVNIFGRRRAEPSSNS